MANFSRRQFLGATVGLTGALALYSSPVVGYDLGVPLGFQAHGLRVLMSQDFFGTLKRANSLGYERVELVSFKGYSGNTTRDGFAALATLDTAFIRNTIREAGLVAPTCHFKFTEFRDDGIDSSIEWAQGVGIQHMVVVDLPAMNSMDDAKKNFEAINHFAERVHKTGMQLAHHTQPDDWKSFDGVLVMDEFLKDVDAQHCQLELDLETTMTMGIDGANYMSSNPDRFLALHLRDVKTPSTYGNYLNSLPVGQGDIDWKKTLEAAKSARVSMYFVEMELPATGDAIEALKISADYIHSLKA